MFLTSSVSIDPLVPSRGGHQLFFPHVPLLLSVLSFIWYSASLCQDHIVARVYLRPFSTLFSPHWNFLALNLQQLQKWS